MQGREKSKGQEATRSLVRCRGRKKAMVAGTCELGGV